MKWVVFVISIILVMVFVLALDNSSDLNNTQTNNTPTNQTPLNVTNSTQNNTQENNTTCIVKEDCYPTGFVPANCGTFYSCINNKCASGSNSCANENNTNIQNNTQNDSVKRMKDIRKEIKNEWRNMTPEEKKDFLKEIKEERNELRLRNAICPTNCTCSGSTVKCMLADGTRIMTVYAGKSGNVIIQIKGENMTTNVTLYHHSGRIFGVFKNKTGNETKEIMILPDQVKEKIKEKVKAKCEENENCSIELDENATYRAEVKKKARLFFIFPVKERIKIYVDSETGNIIIKKPWWRFLVNEIDED